MIAQIEFFSVLIFQKYVLMCISSIIQQKMIYLLYTCNTVLNDFKDKPEVDPAFIIQKKLTSHRRERIITNNFHNACHRSEQNY